MVDVGLEMFYTYATIGKIYHMKLSMRGIDSWNLIYRYIILEFCGRCIILTVL